MRKTLLKSLLVAAAMVAGATNALADDKTVVKYSFDDATSPSLTAGSRVSFDYDKTSVITSTKFLNAFNNTNGDPGSSTLSLGSTDLSGETWTLSFEWAACGGCNSKADHTTLKAGDTNLFDLTGNSNWNTTVTITYTGSDGSKTLPVPGCDKGKRFNAAVGDQYNTTTYWHHIVVTGDASGVKMTITNSSTGTAIVEDVVLSETNVNPTSLIIEPCCGGGIGIDELSLTYYVEGEVIQTPVANYTAVDGINRTITATCETEGVTIQHSTDGETFEDGASVTVSESGNIYFKAVKGSSESDVLTFAAEAGEEITLVAPVINRTSNTSVTISADETGLLLSPVATVYYEYGSQSGSFLSSETKVLTVEAEATITAYAEATGYATSATSERAVALFPENVGIVENTPTKTAGLTTPALGTDIISVSDREYVALLLDGTQWGTNVYLQNLALVSGKTGEWGVRNGNWYINTTDNQWILVRNLKAGDILVVNSDYAAADMANATYSEEYTYEKRHAYVVTADGDVEIALKKVNAATMHYLYGIYAYTNHTTAAITSAGWSTLYTAYALDFSEVAGLNAYIATVSDNTVTLTKVTSVPANTGVVLEGAEGNYNIPVTATPASEQGDLQGSATEATALEDGYKYYGLAFNEEDDQVQFSLISGGTIAAGKAYLKIANAEANVLNVVFGDETTGVSTIAVDNNNSEAVYNLNGQKASAMHKGLYVKGGKKFIVK